MKDPVHKMSVLQIVRCLLQLKKSGCGESGSSTDGTGLSFRCDRMGTNQKAYQIA